MTTELFIFCQNIELTHKVPWIVVVHKFLKQWQATSGKNVPTNYKEKCQLKELIQSGKLAVMFFVVSNIFGIILDLLH